MKLAVANIAKTWEKYNLEYVSNDFPRLAELDGVDLLELNSEVSVRMESSNVYYRASYSSKIQKDCDRCLTKVILPIEGEFSLIIQPQALFFSSSKKTEVFSSDSDTDFYTGQILDLNKYIEDQLILEIPDYVKCSEDCLGLCSQCGVNKNKNSCSCNLN